MINTNALKGVLAENGFSQSAMARKLGITPKTFYTKMRKGIFDSDEIEIMISVLRINNPMSIFFTQKVT